MSLGPRDSLGTVRYQTAAANAERKKLEIPPQLPSTSQLQSTSLLGK